MPLAVLGRDPSLLGRHPRSKSCLEFSEMDVLHSDQLVQSFCESVKPLELPGRSLMLLWQVAYCGFFVQHSE